MSYRETGEHQRLRSTLKAFGFVIAANDLRMWEMSPVQARGALANWAFYPGPRCFLLSLPSDYYLSKQRAA